MLRKEGYQTKFVYSDEIYNRLIDKNSLLESINKEFNFSFINEEVKDVYCEDNGRPSIPPIILDLQLNKALRKASARRKEERSSQLTRAWW